MGDPLLAAFRGVDPAPLGRFTLAAVADLLGGANPPEWGAAGQRLDDYANGPRTPETKLTLPAVTFGGDFTRRRAADLITPSGYVALDFDHLADAGREVKSAAAVAANDERARLVYVTPSGDGIRVVVAATGIVDAATYVAAWQHAANIFAPLIELPVDGGAKDLARLSFLSRGDGDVYHNPTSATITPPTAPQTETGTNPPTRHQIQTQHDLRLPQRQLTSEQLRERLSYIDAAPRQMWRDIVWGLRAGGYSLDDAHWWASTAGGAYDADGTDQLWRDDDRGGIGFGTVHHHAEAGGWRPDLVHIPQPGPTATPQPTNTTNNDDDDNDDDDKPKTLAQHLAAIEAPPEFWNPPFDPGGVLAAIHAHAVARVISPLALLAGVLVHSASTIAHDWRLPAIVAAPSATTIFAAVIGDSGAGKSGTLAAANEMIRVPDHNKHTTRATHPHRPDAYQPTQAIGSPVSGEGILESLTSSVVVPAPTEYEEPRTERQQTGHRMRWSFDEVAQLITTRGRQGSTLAETLRSMWSGGEMSTVSAESDRRRYIAGGTYTAGVLAGAQPDLAATLWAERGLGDAQRWLWVPAHGRDPLTDHDIPTPVTIPHWTLPDDLPGWAPAPITTTPEIRATIRADRHRNYTGHGDPHANHHTNLLRLRVAAHAARICGQPPHIDATTWDWAHTLLTVSERVGTVLVAHAAQQADNERRAKAIAAAERRADERADDFAHTADVEHDATTTLARRIWRHGTGPLNASHLTHSQRAHAIRSHGSTTSLVADAIAGAIAAGYITATEKGGYGQGSNTPPKQP